MFHLVHQPKWWNLSFLQAGISLQTIPHPAQYTTLTAAPPQSSECPQHSALSVLWSSRHRFSSRSRTHQLVTTQKTPILPNKPTCSRSEAYGIADSYYIHSTIPLQTTQAPLSFQPTLTNQTQLHYLISHNHLEVNLEGSCTSQFQSTHMEN